jgi:hypothetical protein
VVGNNVLAHVPRLMEGNQFDTIYHEHFSYFSFLTVMKIMAAFDLTIFDVEELWTSVVSETCVEALRRKF